MTAIGTLKARIIEAALEEARTQEAYRKAWDEDEGPYEEPLKGKTLEACLVNLRSLTALQEAGRALYAEMQKRLLKEDRQRTPDEDLPTWMETRR